MDNQPPSFPGARKPSAAPSFSLQKPTTPLPDAKLSGSGLKFPTKPVAIRPLILPRRISPLQRAQEASQASLEARRSIDAIMSQSRTPWGTKSSLSGQQVDNLEKALRALESRVTEREMALADAENKLAERDRALAETEALLHARELVIEAMRKQPPPAVGVAVNPAELDALTKLKEELDRQEASLKEQRDAIREREEFLDQSETALFGKMQAQQEKETELEQKAEDVKRAMIKAGMIKPDPKEPMEKA